MPRRKMYKKKPRSKHTKLSVRSNLQSSCRFRVMGWTNLINSAGANNFNSIQIPINMPGRYFSFGWATPTAPGTNISAPLPNIATNTLTNIFGSFDSYRVVGCQVRLVQRYVDNGATATTTDNNSVYIAFDRDDSAGAVETTFLNKSIFPRPVNQGGGTIKYKYTQTKADASIWFNTANAQIDPTDNTIANTNLTPTYYKTIKIGVANPLSLGHFARLYVIWDIISKSPI